MRQRYASMSGIVVLVLLTSGCAFTVDRIDLAYTPQANVQKMDGASGIAVEVMVKDVRPQTDRVSAKGVAAQAAPIVSNQDVAKVVKEAIEAELSQRGYTSSPGNVRITCDLSNFWTSWQMGFWAGKAHGSCQLSVKVRDKNGTIVFSEIVNGESTKDGIQITSGANAKETLEAALQDAMKKLFQMPDFFEAIAKANGKT